MENELRTDRKPSPIQYGSMNIDLIKHSPALMKQNTGITTYHKFQWVFNLVERNLSKLKYYKGEHSNLEKSYQSETTDRNKPGIKRKLPHMDEMLLTVIKLKLDLLEDDLAFRFGISTSLVSQILSTWIPLLAKELQGLIYWPTREEIETQSLHTPHSHYIHHTITT